MSEVRTRIRALFHTPAARRGFAGCTGEGSGAILTPEVAAALRDAGGGMATDTPGGSGVRARHADEDPSHG